MFLISLPTLYFSFTPINQTVIFLTNVNGSFFKKGPLHDSYYYFTIEPIGVVIINCY